MKTAIGILIILGGIVTGLYLGLWVCFIGGIVALINEIKSPEEVQAMAIAFGIARAFFASIVSLASAVILIILGGMVILVE